MSARPSRFDVETAGPAPLAPVGRAATAVVTLGAVALAIYQLFNFKFLGGAMLENRYLYLLAGAFLSLTFLTFPLRPGRPAGIFDWPLAIAAAAASAYLAQNAERNLMSGWEFAAPETATWVSIGFYALVLEATRRAGGLVLFLIVLVFSLYPTFADVAPGPLAGFQTDFFLLAPYHIWSSESVFGIPMRAFGSLVIGFIVFGAVLQKTGGGQFFNDLALALVGRFRGGAAKVSIFASGFMGSMSGSVISNVLTTGAVSIPAMKRTGFSSRHAAATEACASTGGVLMPPIMGATAFVMASFLGVPYVEIMLAAVIPSVLFYFGLFTQIDAYSAKRRLKGLEPAEVPSLRAALMDGWPYIAVFAVLIYMMVAWRMESVAPFYATVLLLVINQVLKRHRFTLSSFVDLIVGVGRALAELTAVLLGVGLIVGAFSATGLAGTLVNELIFIAGASIIALLLMGALTAFVFGMGMTVTACYIFLAVVLAPALEQAGLNRIAVHMFILYWGMVSFITPPVALGAFAAATMAGANGMKTALEAMRLGGVIYVAPFFFVLNPALVGQAPAWEVAYSLITALVGIWFLSSALQGHVSLIGGFAEDARGWVMRAMLLAAGLLLATPTGGLTGMPTGSFTAIGLAVAALPLLAARAHGRRTQTAA